ncbi:MAG: creatininase family protein [Methanospirillaceae archaeon]|nr:creatininase family protein [Methanospirillaceae archaeon]
MKKNPLKVQHMVASDPGNRSFDTVILPLGSLESHGPHLPLGTDALTAYHLSLEIAEKVPGTVVLPPVHYGVSEHYRDFPFTISLRFETETAILEDILQSVYREGIRKCFIMNGHDGNIAPIEIASRKVKVEHPDIRIVSLDAWWDTVIPLLPDNFFEVWQGLGHGGEGETSMALALFPELCKPEKAVGVVPALPRHLSVKWLFRELTNCGATGDPTKGSREKGLYMKQILVDAIVDELLSLDASGWDYCSILVGKR